MFVAIDLHPLDDGIKPSAIILHPLSASYHLDDFSLPISFPVNGQAQLRVQDGEPLIYCKHSRCDAHLNGAPPTKMPRRVHTGDRLRIFSSDPSTPHFALYAVQVAYFSFSDNLRQEVGLDLPRIETGAVLALQTDTTSAFPLALPVAGKLPSPAPHGTNWDGVRDLIHDVRTQALLQSEAQERRAHAPRSSPLSNPEVGTSTAACTYAQIVSKPCPSSSSSTLVSTSVLRSTPPRTATGLPSTLAFPSASTPFTPTPHSTPTSPSTSVLPPGTSPCPSTSVSADFSPPPLQPSSDTFIKGEELEALIAPPLVHGPVSTTVPLGASKASFTPASGIDPLTVALDRIRADWLNARHALLEVDLTRCRSATSSTSSPLDAPPVSSSSAVTGSERLRARRASIECVQAALLDLLSTPQLQQLGFSSQPDTSAAPVEVHTSIQSGVDGTSPSAFESTAVPLRAFPSRMTPSVPQGSHFPPHTHISTLPPPSSLGPHTALPTPLASLAPLPQLYHLLSNLAGPCTMFLSSVIPVSPRGLSSTFFLPRLHHG
ncbi:hypothetical protein CF319_g9230 [Tilletia indica]|nr:hypothetical protein CF319_g9230 [Tilletia indica]